MKTIEELLGPPDWKPSGKKRGIPKSKPIEPDAVVLIMLTHKCRCGNYFAVPNKDILLRFGNSLLAAKSVTWRNEFNDLPREVKEMETEVLACYDCFGNTTFAVGNF